MKSQGGDDAAKAETHTGRVWVSRFHYETHREDPALVCFGLLFAIRSAGASGTARSGLAGAGRLSRGGVVGRNLATAGSRAACIGGLAGSGSAGPVAGRVVHTITLRPRHARTALLRGRLVALAGLSVAILLRAASGLCSAIHLLRSAAGLAFTISRGAATFCVISHRIAPGNAVPALRTHT